MLIALVLQGDGSVFGVVAGGLFDGYGPGSNNMGDVFGEEFLLALWKGTSVQDRHVQGLDDMAKRDLQHQVGQDVLQAWAADPVGSSQNRRHMWENSEL